MMEIDFTPKKPTEKLTNDKIARIVLDWVRLDIFGYYVQINYRRIGTPEFNPKIQDIQLKRFLMEGLDKKARIDLFDPIGSQEDFIEYVLPRITELNLTDEFFFELDKILVKMLGKSVITEIDRSNATSGIKCLAIYMVIRKKMEAEKENQIVLQDQIISETKIGGQDDDTGSFRRKINEQYPDSERV